MKQEGIKPFIGRESELAKLQEIYNSTDFEFGVVYGRRRIGKSTLLKKFAEGKSAIYLVANEKKLEMNLEAFAKIIGEKLSLSHLKFKSFSDMMEFLFENVNSKTIVIIDEFTYLVAVDKAVLSELQNAVDKYKEQSSLKLVISGSHVGMVEDMLAYKKPLYARKTFSINLKEFDYYEAALFYPRYSYEDKIRAYAICGGVPYYLSLIDDAKTLEQNIISIFIAPHAYLENELDFLFQTEFRNKVNYASILQVVANGKTKLNEISQLSHINDTAKTSTYLKPLIAMGLVDKENVFGDGKGTRRTIYKVKNNLVNFVYTFIEENQSARELLAPTDFYSIIVAPRLDEYVSFIFEDVCKQFISRRNKLPIVKDKVLEIGRYWLNDSVTKAQIEIDICTRSEKGYTVYECKWQNTKIDIATMGELEEKAGKITEFEVTAVGAFSRSGFENAVPQNYPLTYTLNEIFNI
ncbi:MAG: ATP-binding protein [Clostridiales bacterium]|jgi:AAA+ ATPase superfamily predicted ATPase|nr:ATP-binding protein [Clostridiales bacterium]